MTTKRVVMIATAMVFLLLGNLVLPSLAEGTGERIWTPQLSPEDNAGIKAFMEAEAADWKLSVTLKSGSSPDIFYMVLGSKAPKSAVWILDASFRPIFTQEFLQSFFGVQALVDKDLTGDGQPEPVVVILKKSRVEITVLGNAQENFKEIFRTEQDFPFEIKEKKTDFIDADNDGVLELQNKVVPKSSYKLVNGKKSKDSVLTTIDYSQGNFIVTTSLP